MNDAAKCGGSFTGFSIEERNGKLFDLAKVIGRYGFPAIHLTIKIEPFDQAIAAQEAKRPFNDPYFFAFHTTIFSVFQDLVARGQRRRFDILFDEHKIFVPRVKLWWPLMRSLIVAINSTADAVLPVEPLFRSDIDEKPLQAADMLAWFFRRRAAGTDPLDNQFDWLLPRLFTIPVSEYSSTWDSSGWQAGFESTYPPLLIDRVVKFYDELL